MQTESQAILAEHSYRWKKNRTFLITFIIKTDSLLESFNWKSTILQAFAFYQTLLTGPIEIASGSECHIFQLCEGSCGDPLKQNGQPRQEAGRLACEHLVRTSAHGEGAFLLC